MSLPTLIDMIMRKTCRTVNLRYKQLMQQELTWDQFLTKVTFTNNKKARWDNSKRKDELKEKCHPHSESKRALSSQKKVQSGLSDCAEEFFKGLDIFKEEYQKQVWERLCLGCGLRVTTLVNVRLKPLLAWEKAGRVKFA